MLKVTISIMLTSRNNRQSFIHLFIHSFIHFINFVHLFLSLSVYSCLPVISALFFFYFRFVVDLAKIINIGEGDFGNFIQRWMMLKITKVYFVRNDASIECEANGGGSVNR